MEGVIKIRELETWLKSNNLLIAPAHLVTGALVKGVPVAQYRKKILKEKMLSAKQISDARLWGDICKKRVYSIIRETVPEDEIVKIGKNETIKIPIATVKSIAASRGEEI